MPHEHPLIVPHAVPLLHVRNLVARLPGSFLFLVFLVTTAILYVKERLRLYAWNIRPRTHTPRSLAVIFSSFRLTCRRTASAIMLVRLGSKVEG